MQGNREELVTIFFVQAKLNNARIAQLVEHDLAKVGVAGSNPVSRSEESEKEHSCSFFIHHTGCSDGGMVDTPDLKSCGH